MTTSNNTSIEMPESIYSQATEQQVITRLNDALSDLHFAIADIRAAGAKIETVQDIEATTPEKVRQQLAADKAAYFANMKFVPKALRHQADEQFSSMERELVPLAEALQKAAKACPVPVTIKETSGATGDYCVEYNEQEYQEYVKAASTVVIPENIRTYYSHLLSFVAAWDSLKDAAAKLGITTPDGNLIKELMDSRDIILNGEAVSNFGKATDMSISTDKMFTLLSDGVITSLL